MNITSFHPVQKPVVYSKGLHNHETLRKLRPARLPKSLLHAVVSTRWIELSEFRLEFGSVLLVDLIPDRKKDFRILDVARLREISHGNDL